MPRGGAQAGNIRADLRKIMPKFLENPITGYSPLGERFLLWHNLTILGG
jgi:hypothetical protein